MKTTTKKIKRLKPAQFLETMKRIKLIDREMLTLRLEREFLVSKVKPELIQSASR